MNSEVLISKSAGVLALMGILGRSIQLYRHRCLGSIVLLRGFLKASGSSNCLDHRPMLCEDGSGDQAPVKRTCCRYDRSKLFLNNRHSSFRNTVYCYLVRKYCISWHSG